MPDELLLEQPALPSSPIRLATHWTADYLTRFLMDPKAHHPAGRMPDLGLEEQDAADLAAYLQLLPGTAPVVETAEPAQDPQLVRKGSELFVSKGCAACHDVGAGYQPREAPGLIQLGMGDLDAGCLSNSPGAGAVPLYYLSELQRKAIQLALQMPAPPESRLKRELTQRDCYACHSYEGRGGPELGRQPFFGAFDPYDPEMESFLPPQLDGAADLPLLEILTGAREPKYPEVRSRMVILPEGEARAVADLFHAADPDR